eukprot:TRINITY_DN3146_c0_g1_i1.p1 TRINITY_DN3146_c0_g1~~TRINITY_DN3146_c0_g1_i1.p1  ORF type:complete len:775 (-),score=58.73 TRINITY_DN3146_c0_g1_i1:71-2395(-)
MQCSLSGPGVQDGLNREGHFFSVQTDSANTEVTSISVTGPDGAAQVKWDKDKGKGLYKGTLPGTYKIAVTFVKTVTMAKAVCSIKGSTVEGGVVNQTSDFTVDTGIGTGGHAEDVEVTIFDPKGKRTTVGRLEDSETGSYYGKFTPVVPGRHKVTVRVWGEEIPGSPFQPVFKHVVAAANRSIARGCGVDGGKKARVGNTLTFTIVGRDSRGDQVDSGGDPFDIKIVNPNGGTVDFSIMDHDDGTYTVGYEPTVVGDHAVHISLAGQPIAGSPYRLDVFDRKDKRGRKEERSKKRTKSGGSRSRTRSRTRSGSPAKAGSLPKPRAASPKRKRSETPPPRNRSTTPLPARTSSLGGSPFRESRVGQVNRRRGDSNDNRPTRGAPSRDAFDNRGRSRTPVRRARTPTPSRSPVRRRGSSSPPRRGDYRPVSRFNQTNNSSLWIGGLPHDVRAAELQERFEKFGRVKRVDVRKGFAFLDFELADDAREAQNKLHGSQLGTAVLQVEFKMDRTAPRQGRPPYNSGGFASGIQAARQERHRAGGRAKNWRIELEGLPNSVGWQDIKDWGKDAGLRVEFAKTYGDGGGAIEFTERSEYEAAWNKLDGRSISGAVPRLLASREQPDGMHNSRSPSPSPARSGSPRKRRPLAPKGEPRRDSRGRPPARGPRSAPPSTYTCHRCGVAGHWIQDCTKPGPRRDGFRGRKRSRSLSSSASRRSPIRSRSRSLSNRKSLRVDSPVKRTSGSRSPSPRGRGPSPKGDTRAGVSSRSPPRKVLRRPSP